MEAKSILETMAKILIEETINDGVDAAVAEGQPVCQRVDVGVDDPQFIQRQVNIV